ncbi:DUF6789 family protein [Sphingomonas sp. TREG-RG-20F-R18-01]|uniref:DUF6789 family protein n=1 Tax=Sphingomonas sp. TREG-RG-20F-R18-01 TaxID=2914982 RepID=UPI001F588CE8|nr:DUF6789 family protein [Sphingomonas sp. TREG-RG-20F-R18-01]
MGNVAKSMVAAFAATVVLSAMMVVKAMMGIMPQLDIAAMLASMMGAPGNLALGWLGHFMIGTIGYGVVFALLAGRLPGSLIVQGVILGVIGWLVMMIMIMPMAGAGLFGLNLGIAAPIMTLMLHMIFGAVLGAVYKATTANT